MAKLSAHGYEVARLRKTMSVGNSNYIVTLSFRSDGHIMRNLKVLDVYGPGEHHTYGWKLYEKLQDRKRDPVARLLKVARQWRDQSEATGRLLDYSESLLAQSEAR